jgi:sugar-specific transcriptional regulator TrmB
MTCDAALPVLSALGGGLVSGGFLLAGALFNQRREDRREQIRRHEESRERLRDERRRECVRLIAAAERQTTGEDVRGALDDAQDALLFLGDENLARVASDLASAARQHSQSKNYLDARAEFYRVAKKLLGYYDL